MKMKRQKVIDLDCVEQTKFDIDWDDVMEEEEEEVVPELEVIGSARTPPQEPIISSDDLAVRTLRDSELDEQLKRQRSLLVSLSGKLPDNGEKIRNRIGNLEYEKQRRMLLKTKMDSGRCQNLKHSTGSGSPDVYIQASTSSKNTSRQGINGSKDVSRSTFSAHFSENKKMDTQSIKPLDEELQDWSHESWRSKDDRDTITLQRNRSWSLPKSEKRQQSRKNFYSGSDDAKHNRKRNEASVKRMPKESSPYFLVDDDEDIIGCETPREWNSQASLSQSSNCRKKSDDAVINLDEEEFQQMIVEQAFELPKGLPEELCYPSRDDPNLVQVGLKDLKCLSPREYLSSSVINFYIRFLQHEVYSANQTAAHCHFFNTFFYKMLKNAISYEGNDKDAFFVKFRRWWKGTDLFHKSYIFVPIHEDLHWSLVIICIPDKEDESGLTILHLDSLGYHPRKSIVENVKRFLIEEWNYLNQDAPLDSPISENIWRDLPHSINEAEVQVPQQKNDCDCGLFMLFFIKRFIEEAPQRMKSKDLGMIHRKWFKPNEASAQRITIWNILIDLFRNGNQTDLTCID